MPRDVNLRDQREQRDQLPVASIIALGGVAEVVRVPFRIDFFFHTNFFRNCLRSVQNWEDTILKSLNRTNYDPIFPIFSLALKN